MSIHKQPYFLSADYQPESSLRYQKGLLTIEYNETRLDFKQGRRVKHEETTIFSSDRSADSRSVIDSFLQLRHDNHHANDDSSGSDHTYNHHADNYYSHNNHTYDNNTDNHYADYDYANYHDTNNYHADYHYAYDYHTNYNYSDYDDTDDNGRRNTG